MNELKSQGISLKSLQKLKAELKVDFLLDANLPNGLKLQKNANNSKYTEHSGFVKG